MLSKSMQFSTIWIRQTPPGYVVVNASDTKALEDALARNEDTVQLQGECHFLNMNRTTRHTYCNIQQSGDKSLTRYSCLYYYHNTATMWAPCHYNVCHGLEVCRFSSSSGVVSTSSPSPFSWRSGSTPPLTTTYTDGERVYSVQDMTQVNTESGRIRHMIFLQGSHEIRTPRELGVWYCTSNNHTKTSEPLPYDMNERLEAEYARQQGGDNTSKVMSSNKALATTTDCCTVAVGKDGVVTGTMMDPRSRIAMPCRRYQIRFMVMNHSNQLEVVDPTVSDKLSEYFSRKTASDSLIQDGQRRGNIFVDGSHQYDFDEWTRTDLASSDMVRPFFRLVISDGAPSSLSTVKNVTSTTATNGGCIRPAAVSNQVVLLPSKSHDNVVVHPQSASCNPKYLKLACTPCVPDNVSLLMEETQHHTYPMHALYLCSILLHEMPGVQYVFGPCVRELMLESKIPTTFHCHTSHSIPVMTSLFDTGVGKRIKDVYSVSLTWVGADAGCSTFNVQLGSDVTVQVVVSSGNTTMSSELAECDRVKLQKGVKELLVL